MKINHVWNEYALDVSVSYQWMSTLELELLKKCGCKFFTGLVVSERQN